MHASVSGDTVGSKRQFFAYILLVAYFNTDPGDISCDCIASRSRRQEPTVSCTDEFCVSGFGGEIKRIQRFVGLRKEPRCGKKWTGRSDKKHYEEIMECADARGDRS